MWKLCVLLENNLEVQGSTMHVGHVHISLQDTNVCCSVTCTFVFVSLFTHVIASN